MLASKWQAVYSNHARVKPVTQMYVLLPSLEFRITGLEQGVVDDEDQ